MESNQHIYCDNKIKSTSIQDGTDYLLEYCVNTWEKFLSVEEYDCKTGWTDAKIRSIIVGTYDHVRIMNIIITFGFINSISKERPTYRVDGGEKISKLLGFPRLKNGNEWLFLYNYKKDLPNKEVVHSSLKRMFDKIRSGWEKSCLDDHPRIFLKKDTAMYFLYIKKKNDIEMEDTLFRFLASAFDLKTEMTCHNYWDYDLNENPYKDIMYMWVKKDSIEKVNDAFMLNLL